MRWFSQRRSPTAIFFWGGGGPRGNDPQIRTRPRFLYNALTLSFIILCLLFRKLPCWQTNKQTDAAENIQRSSLRYTTLGNHSHCTLFDDQQSSLLDITASIIRGSSIGPDAYVVTAGDMTAAVSGNSLCKFADELIWLYQPPMKILVILSSTYRIGPSGRMKLNCDKSCEVVFTDSKRRRRHEPTPLPGIVRCRSLKMLGVVIADDISVTQHVRRLVTSSAQTTYALRVLRCHGLSNTALQLVYRATVVARLTYAASAWRGFAKASDH